MVNPRQWQETSRASLGSEFSGAEVNGRTVSVSMPQVKMTVYGNLYCRELIKSGGNVSKALLSIVPDIFDQN